jgi:phosphoglycolate phosphatase
MNKFEHSCIAAIIFDMDGTLLDSLEDIALAMNAVLEKNGWPPFSINRYKQLVGDGAEELVRRALPEELRNLLSVRARLAEFKFEYEARWRQHTIPYPGIDEMLTDLTRRGIKCSILSNKHDDLVGKMAATLLPGREFQHVLGASSRYPRKPDPQGAIQIAREIGSAVQTCAFIGDSEIDMQTARNAGMRAIGVAWGFRSVTDLVAAGAEIVLHSPAELCRFLDAQ